MRTRRRLRIASGRTLGGRRRRRRRLGLLGSLLFGTWSRACLGSGRPAMWRAFDEEVQQEDALRSNRGSIPFSVCLVGELILRHVQKASSATNVIGTVQTGRFMFVCVIGCKIGRHEMGRTSGMGLKGKRLLVWTNQHRPARCTDKATKSSRFLRPILMFI